MMNSYFHRQWATTLFLMFLANNFVHADSERLEFGKNEFNYSCAACHGESGEGDGPFVEFLTVKPADLTRLSENNDGHFPFSRVLSTIDGRLDVKPHGPRAMPVWGARYKAEAQEMGMSEGEATLLSQGLILDLVVYLNSIQVSEEP